MKYFHRAFYRTLQLLCALLILQAVSSCKTGQSTDDWPTVGPVYLKLFQDGKTIHLRDMSTYKMKRMPFSLIFPLREYNDAKDKFHSARISCSESSKLHKINEGGNLDSANSGMPFFARGTGLAPSANGKYDALYITDYPSHHYITYHSKQSNLQRAELVKKIDDGHYEVMLDISKINIKDRDIPIKKSKNKKLYFIVFMDDNLNRVADQGELLRFAIEFGK